MIRWIARAAVANPVAANLTMVALLVCGVLAYRAMPREVFPDFSLDAIEVFSVYPGASPEDVERLVTAPIEDVLESVEGIDEVESTSTEGVSRVILSLRAGADVDRALADARDRLRAGDLDLPPEVEDPAVYEVRNRFPVVAVFVYGWADLATLRALAEEHRRGLEGLPGVARVDATGLREPRLWIEVEPVALERFGLTLEAVGAAVAARVAEVPLGSLETDAGERLLRVGGAVRWARDLEDLPVVARPDGAVVRLHQVARLSDAFEREVTRGRFNGLPCVHLQVTKDASGDTIDIARAVRAYVAEHGDALPPGTALGTNSDLSVYVENRLRTMAESGTWGAALVLLALLLFLEWRVALVTALGIPVSFVGGILVAGALGVTMNMITMFALIVVLGMIVDDAIVVGENVFRRMEGGEDAATASVEGTVEVGRPVVATILTSVAAFLPLLVMGGTTGLFLRPLPLVVSACLAVSLVEALLILPAHMAHWTSPRALAALRERGRGAGGEVRRWYAPLRDGYVRLLRGALRWRLATLGGAVGIALVVFAVGKARIPFVLFDDFESKLFYVSLRLHPSASMEDTARATRVVEERLFGLPESEVESLHTLMGVAATDASSYEVGEHLGQVWVELREGGARARTTAAVLADVRSRMDGLPPEVVGWEIAQPQSGPTGRAIEVVVTGPDLERLASIAAELRARLAGYPGVVEVRDDTGLGKPELSVELSDHGRALGLTEAGLASELRAAFEGVERARLRRGDDEVELVVKHPEELRRNADALARLRVATPAGDRVPLASVARVVERRGASVVSRDDRRRAARVTADVDKARGNAARIVDSLEATVLPELEDAHPGYDLEIGGEAEDTAESLAGLASAALVALALIYLILGTLFRSFLQPLVIMFVIPFSGVGAVLGHAVMDRPLTLMSLIGLLALAGVVVNDSLILVDFANQRRRAGARLVAALVEAGRVRFRPILLTSVTTMLGLSPLTFFATGQARFLQPMAISIFYGLAAATLLILVLVPVAYLVLEDALAWMRRPRASWRALRGGRPLHA